MKTNWQFDLNRDGSSEGWEDAAIKNFRGNPLNNLAREIIQNTLDAPKSTDDGIVTVSFQKESVSARSVPNRKELRATIKKCISAADTFVLPDKQENLFLADAALAAPQIDILKITETGTAGMEGPCEPGKPLYKYMKAKGQGGKSFDGARGSHGQGKAAPILCSQLHTIFVSTKWKNKNLIMGRATLSSHYGRNRKEIHNNVGYWGCDFDPVNFDKAMPAWLQRKTPGTNIIVFGFKQFSQWSEILIASVATNFFAVISKGGLRVQIQGFEINKDTLPQIFERVDIARVVEAQSDVPRGDFERAKGYYKAFTEPDFTEEGEVLNLGFFNFFIKKRDDGQQNIALLRDDMFITSAVPRLKRKFGPTFEGFDLLIEPASNASRALVKSMEPPAHDDLNTSWIDDEKMRKKAESGMTHLRKRVAEILERHVKINIDGSEHHAAFDKFFSISGGGEQISDATDPTGGFIFSNRQVSESFQTNATTLAGSWSHELETSEMDDKANNPKENNQPTETPSDGKNKPAPDLGAEQSEDSVKEFRSKPVDLRNVKMRSISADKFTVQFSPERSGNLKLLIANQGSDLKTIMMVKESNKGAVTDNGAIVLECEQDTKIQLEIVLEKPLDGAITLLASGA